MRSGLALPLAKHGAAPQQRSSMIDRSRLAAILDEAGRIAMGLWPGDGHEVTSWEKEPGSPVCDADIEVDGFLRQELGKLLPSAGWLSEETADDLDRLDNGLIWLVDPVDGTRDFLRGRPGWCVSVALISEGRPLIGMLDAPARKEKWVGQAGQGATLNGKPLRASDRDNLVGARVPANSLQKVDQILTMVDQPNSIALRIAMVASDQADLLATLRWGWEWDIGAAALIAREAGATVTDAFGKVFAYNKRDPRAFGVLVTAPNIHGDAVLHLADRARAIIRK